MTWSGGNRASLSFVTLDPAPVTTLGNGAAGTNGTVCPGATGQKLDGFSFVNSAGTNPVTALTVTTTNQAAIASMQIWNEAGTTQYFTTVNNSGSDTWIFGGGTSIPVTTTRANFKVLVTYQGHGTAPAGSTTTNAYVSAFTTVNGLAGTDSTDTTLTLDNATPSAPTGPTCTGTSSSQINLTWTNAGNNSIVVRGPAGGAAPTFVPMDGSSYSTGAQGSDYIVAVGNLTTAADTGLTAGTTYAYRIYAYDACTNYSAAVATSCATTGITTLGNGVAGTSAAVCPGASGQKLDGFSLQNSAGANGVTAMTVTTTNQAAIASMQIWDEAGTAQYFTTVNNSGSNTWIFSGGSAIPVGTSLANFKILVTYQGQGTAPAGNTTTTAYVSAFTTVNGTAGTDTADTTLTLDNLSPQNPMALAGVRCNAQVALSWVNPGDADFAQVLVLRRAGAAVADVPVEGASYTAPGTLGASAIVYAGNASSFTDTGLVNGTAYYYEIFASDGCANYSTGLAAGPYTPSATTADLSITKTAFPSAIDPGQNVTFTITVHNGGPSNATGVIVTDSLPAELTYSSATPSQGTCGYSAPTVTCNLGAVNNGADATVSVVATANSAADAWNTASVTANEADCNPSNNSGAARIIVATQVADLAVTKTGPASTTVPGAVSYLITVTNNGPAMARAVTVTDPVPAGMTLVSASTGWPGGSCTGNPIVTCSLGNMNNAATATITIAVTNDSGGTKSNTATVSSNPATDFDPDNMNNNATATTTVTGTTAPFCATPGKDGSPGTVSGVVNTYYPGTLTVGAGLANTCISVGAPVGAAAVSANDLLLVIQMQDADINSTNTVNYGDGTGRGAGATAVAAGKYEFVLARGAVGSLGCAAGLPITGAGANNGLMNGYTNANATTAKGQMRFQVVRVPQYATVTAGGITAPPWTTNTAAPTGLGTGGIIAIDVQGTLTLNTGAAIAADGLGFRGGAGRQLTGGTGANTDWRTLSTITTNGSKGEGIGGTPEWVQGAAPLQTNQPNDGYPNGSMARGAPANAGGGSTDGNPAANDQNSGGGGGSNGGSGGKGGFSWNSQLDTGGTGAAITPALSKLVLGGGGGGGTRNNNPGDNLASGGAAGGGLVLVRAGELSVNPGAVVSANGEDAYDDTQNDGGGGGGAGGSVAVLVTSGTLSGLTIEARGGKGGSAWKTSAPGTLQPPLNVGINAHGPGGGGGGGVVAYANTAIPPTIDVSGGLNGITTTANYAFGAQPGGAGQILFAGPGMMPGLDSGSDCAPDPGVTLAHSGTTVNLGDTMTILATVTNYAPFVSTSGTITVVITLDSTSPGLTPNPASLNATGWTCGFAGQVVTCSRSDVLAAHLSYPTISFTATVGSTGTAPGSLTNTAALSPNPTNDANLANNVATDLIGVAAPTLARLRAFRAARSGGVVLLSWRSSYEVDNLGYVVYRESGGVRERITPSLVAGSALFVGPRNPLSSGRGYSWVDQNPGGATDLRYWLEDVDLNGTRRLTGPAVPLPGDSTTQAVSSPTLGCLAQLKVRRDVSVASSGLGVERPVSAAAPSKRAPGKPWWDVAGGSAAKLAVRQEGWYRVTKSDLLAAGFDPGSDPARLQLFAEGDELAIRVNDGGDGRFDLADSIEFYGTGLDTPFTDARVYWLVATGGPGRRIGTTPPPPGSYPPAPQSFPYTVERKDRTIFFTPLTSNGDRDNFYADVVTTAPISQELTVTHLDVSATQGVPLAVALQGVTTDTPHVVEVQLNGHAAGSVTFAGEEAKTATLTVPASWIQEGSNFVTLVATGGASDTSMLASVSLTYAHLFVPDQGALRFPAPGSSQVTLGGLLDSSLRVVDVTDPANVKELPVSFSSQGGVTTGTVTTAGQAAATLLAFTPARVLQPDGAAVNTPSALNAKQNRADLVIITHPSLASALPPLQARRLSQGFSSVVVDVTDVYDEFGFGEKSADAIRSFLSYARDKWKKPPRYVLLVGDASFDPRNYLEFGAFDLVPTMMVPTSYLVTFSDDWFVDPDDTGLPKIAVGRLSVGTLAEASTVVSKILNHDQGPPGAWSSGVLLVADAYDPETDFSFENAVSQLQPLVAPGFSVQSILVGQLGEGPAHDAVLSAISAGQRLVNYSGHGSEDLWGKNGFFTGADVPALTNGSKLPVFVLMTCLNGLFADVYVQSFAEDLQKAPNGGAVAVWASSGLTQPGSQAQMNQALFQQLFQSPAITIGDAIMGAKAATSDPDVRRTWILFGDPTMRLIPPP